jgi:CSLREA domain-containing protein
MKRRLIVCCLCSALFLLATFSIARSSLAASTITVTTTSDTIDDTDGLCSLREAIIAANTDAAFGGCAAGSGTDTIMFDPALSYPATIVLTQTGANEDAALTGDLDISGTLTIDGPGAQLLTIDGNQLDRVFEIRSGGRVTVQGLMVQHGNPGAADGGGILIDQASALTLTNSVIFSNTAVSGGGLKSVGTLRVSSSTVSNNHGGGLRNENGVLRLTNVDVISNTGGYGVMNSGGLLNYNTGLVSGNQSGGIYNFSNSAGAELSNLTIVRNTGSGVSNSGVTFATALVLIQSQVLSNTAATGAGVTNNGDSASMSIYRSRIAYNSATASGGGVWNWGAMSIISSTIDHNTASNGAGIRHNKGSLGLTNDTLSFNAATNNGGGLYSDSELGALLTNVTVASNHTNGAPETGGNLYLDGTSLALKNTIVSNGGPEGNCGFNLPASLNSADHNLDSGATCGFAATGDITNTDPLLGPLQDNGGSTPTQALLPGSPAIDHGTASGCPATDQRGLHRPQGASCDIGAYEASDSTPLYALAIAKAGAGSGTVTKSPNFTTYLSGTVVTLTAYPGVGSQFSGWSGALTGVTNPVSLTMSADQIVTATFDLVTHTLAVNTVGNGAVVRYPYQPAYLYGTSVVLTATASPGDVFAGWSGSAGSAINPLTVLMNADKIITATFTPLISYTLDVNIVGNGSGVVTRNPDQAAYSLGTVVTLTAAADTESIFAGWSGSIGGTGNPVTLTMNADHFVTATFLLAPYHCFLPLVLTE